VKPIRFACFSVAALIVCAATPVAAQSPFNELIVFGHSGCDDGNDFLLSAGTAAAPPYFGGRFSNGPLWVEWLAQRLGFGYPTLSKAVPAPIEAGGGGTCCAYGGAETGSVFSAACIGVGPSKVCAPNVGLQIERFFAGGRTLNGDELIVVHAGFNDNSPKIAARNIGEHLATLAAAGGKTFLVPNLGRVSQAPGAKGAVPANDNYVARFNAELARQLDAVEAQYGVTIFRLDMLALTDAIIADPGAFGLVNITEPACPDCDAGIPAPGAADSVVPNPDQYLYWDLEHYTAVVHLLVGEAAADLVLVKRP
jgi:phospholipase/lecithinase/hemolysin